MQHRSHPSGHLETGVPVLHVSVKPCEPHKVHCRIIRFLRLHIKLLPGLLIQTGLHVGKQGHTRLQQTLFSDPGCPVRQGYNASKQRR